MLDKIDEEPDEGGKGERTATNTMIAVELGNSRRLAVPGLYNTERNAFGDRSVLEENPPKAQHCDGVVFRNPFCSNEIARLQG